MARHALVQLTGKSCRPRYAERVRVAAPDGAYIDDGLALLFPGPASFTGDDVVELQLHGSYAVEQRLYAALQDLGCHLAEPGAFTLRAFANGKLDLTQAEGLAALLEAETALQHRQAVDQLRGGLRQKAEAWRRELTSAMAALDAAVDFPDEEDVDEVIAERAAPIVGDLSQSISTILAGTVKARRILDGVTLALIGPPNAGKSSLFNRLVDEERAIVSETAGTTRDVVSATIDFFGHRLTLKDTAGIRSETPSAIEAEGIERARAAGEGADLRLLCWPSGPLPMPTWMEDLAREGDIEVRTQADRISMPSRAHVQVSIHDPSSVMSLQDVIRKRLDALASPGLAPTARQQDELQAAERALEDFSVAAERAPEAGAEALRLAARALERLTGRIAPDDVLDDIFSSFCIGK